MSVTPGQHGADRRRLHATIDDTRRTIRENTPIHRHGPWRSFEAVGRATLDWVDWFNHRRLLEPIGNVPPVKAEAGHYAELAATLMAA